MEEFKIEPNVSKAEFT